MKTKLKAGIIVDGYSIEAWKFKVISRIINSYYGEVSLIIVNDSKSFQLMKHKPPRDSFIIQWLQKLTTKPSKDVEPYDLGKDASGLLKDIPVIEINNSEDFKGDKIGEEEIRCIRGYGLDVILNFGYCDLKWNKINLSKYGVWTFKSDSRLHKSDITSDYWEMAKKTPAARSVMELVGFGYEENTIFYISWESVFPFSLEVNRNKVFWRAALFIPRIMEGVYNNGEDYLNNLIVKFNLDNSPDNKSSIYPSSFRRQITNFFCFTGLIFRQVYKNIFFTNGENWKLFYMIENENLFSTLFQQFRKINSPRNILWADPFVVKRNERFYIFVEELIIGTNKAHISVLEIDINGNLLKSNRIIERPYHMSYPFVFELDNTYYMIPETSGNKTIELYRCNNFPYKWDFVKTIMNNVNTVDTTLFNYNGKWWLFTSIDKTENISGYDTELFLFFAKDIFSDNWESHPLNPIISDVRTARPAGNIFIREGKIFRPSQDCSGRYGRALNLNQIMTLTETDYKEVMVKKYEPVWNRNLKGIHTFNFDNGMTLIDGYSFQRKSFLFN